MKVEQLRIGQPAPNGSALNVDGHDVELGTLWSGGPTLLTFLRHFG